MKNKKIIFLLPNLSEGGGEKAVSELSLNLPDYIETTIVLFKNLVSFPYKGKLFFLNLPISNNFLLRIYCFFLAIHRFKKIIKKEKPDYTISFGTPANAINILINKKPILRIDSFMTAACKGFEGRIYKILIKILYNKSKKIITVSKEVANDLIENFGIKKEKIKVIYNPIDIKEIQNLAKEHLKPDYEEIFKNPVVISMGRLSKEKNHCYLIEVFKEVKAKVGTAKLVILGTGKTEPHLRQLIKDLNLEGSAYLLGWQENPFKFLAKSKVFVLSSLWEGLPYSVLEAMACGLPIISVDCKSGPREILAPNTDISQRAENIEYADYGILTPPIDEKAKSEKSLEKAMIEVLTDKKMADNLAKKSKQRAEDFDIKKIIKKYDFLGY